MPHPKQILSSPSPARMHTEVDKGFLPFLTTYPATLALIAINILLFAWMCSSGVNLLEPSASDLLKWGGNARAYTAGGEGWRLLTSLFVHVGIVHLGLNLYALLQAGIFLEPLLGSWRYLAVYASTGVVASVASVWWSDARVSAGASGAIFGLYGLFLALLLTNLLEKAYRRALLQSMGIFLIYNLIFGLQGNVDNSAHLGGLFSGFALGFAFYPFLKKQKGKNLPVLITLFLALSVAVLFFSTHQDDSLSFEKALHRFAESETRGIRALKEIDNVPNEQIVRLLDQQAAPAWREAKGLIEGASRLKLGENLARKRELLSKYIDLRIRQTDLFRQYYRTNQKDLAVAKELADVNQQLRVLLQEVRALQDHKE